MAQAPAGSRLAPGPRGYLLLGSLFDVRRDRLGLVTRLRREYGDLVRFKMGSRTLHLISHPDYVRYVLHENQANYFKGVGLAQAKRWLGEGLVTSEGDKWARQRRLVQPSFHQARLGPFSSVVTETTASMLERWSALAQRNETIDLSAEMMRLTASVIAKVMFSSDIADAAEMGGAFTTALRDCMVRMTEIVALPEWIPIPGHRRFKQALRTLDGIVYAIIQEHRRGGVERDDLVTRLLNERDASGESLSDEEVRDQVMTILLAGHETTATSIAWTLHLLGQHPGALKAMQEESERVLGGRLPTHEDIPRLVWTRQVYEESLRLYPPVWLIPRRAVAADEVGGYYIAPESDMLICPWVIHRHPDYWADPETFDPERFSVDRPSRPPYTFLPFGAGPRACVGKSLATMEALLILAMTTQQFHLEPVAGNAIVPEPLLTLRFRHGIHMRPVLRHAELAHAVSH